VFLKHCSSKVPAAVHSSILAWDENAFGLKTEKITSAIAYPQQVGAALTACFVSKTVTEN